MFGENKFLITNSQRFRNENEISVKRLTGKKRWIYVGDSFTFGYGVDNNNCYCSYLSKFFPNIEYVNMGEGGYGCDQMYIQYLRDGIKFEHDVLIFAFITDDFKRMMSNMFNIYPKPYLDVNDSSLEIKNTPVPECSFMLRNFPRFMDVKDQLGLCWLANIISPSIGVHNPGTDRKQIIESDEKFSNIITLIFSNLNKESVKSGRTVLFVHLPQRMDYFNDESLMVRNFLNMNSQKYNWNYLDLIDDFRKIESDSIPLLFIQKDIPGYLGSAGHYTEEENKKIAELIINRIRQNSKISKLLE
jgi:hypothetical protein